MALKRGPGSTNPDMVTNGILLSNEDGWTPIIAGMNLTRLISVERSRTQESTHNIIPCKRSLRTKSTVIKIRAELLGAGAKSDRKGA